MRRGGLVEDVRSRVRGDSFKVELIVFSMVDREMGGIGEG